MSSEKGQESEQRTATPRSKKGTTTRKPKGHEIPVGRPMTEEEIREREALWNPIIHENKDKLRFERLQAVTVPKLAEKPQPSDSEEKSPQKGSPTQESPRMGTNLPSARARKAAQEWLELLEGDPSASGTKKSRVSPKVERDPFVVSTKVTNKTFETEDGYAPIPKLSPRVLAPPPRRTNRRTSPQGRKQSQKEKKKQETSKKQEVPPEKKKESEPVAAEKESGPDSEKKESEPAAAEKKDPEPAAAEKKEEPATMESLENDGDGAEAAPEQ